MWLPPGRSTSIQACCILVFYLIHAGADAVVTAKVNWKRTDTESKVLVAFQNKNGEQKPKNKEPKEKTTPKQKTTHTKGKGKLQ